MILFNSFGVISQFDVSKLIVNVQAKVIDSSGKPVIFAHITAMKHKKSTITDTSGVFYLTVLKGDSLRIKSLSYETKYIQIPDTISSKEYFVNIILKKRNYKLSVVDIYDVRWKDFVFEFSKTTTIEDKLPSKLYSWLDALISKNELAMIDAAGTIGFSIPYKSKRDKQIEKLLILKSEEQKDKIVHKKLNRKLIGNVTGLKGDDLTEFMKYCNISRDFVINSNQYDIIMEIKHIYEKYRIKTN